jgi:hypothetical protein
MARGGRVKFEIFKSQSGIKQASISKVCHILQVTVLIVNDRLTSRIKIESESSVQLPTILINFKFKH